MTTTATLPASRVGKSPTTRNLIDGLAYGDIADPHGLALNLLGLALNNNDGKLDRSVSNCHVAGLDSVVLSDDTATGGGMVRFFWAKAGGHPLVNIHGRQGHFVLGLHNHRYPLALIPLVGSIGQVTTEVRGWRPSAREKHVLHEYTFRSQLADDDVDAVETVYRRTVHASWLDVDYLDPGRVVVMAPDDLHTVHVPDDDGEGVAWMVIEGPAVPGAVPLIYSPRDDLTITSTDLYRPMAPERAYNVAATVYDLAVQA